MQDFQEVRTIMRQAMTLCLVLGALALLLPVASAQTKTRFEAEPWGDAITPIDINDVVGMNYYQRLGTYAYAGCWNPNVFVANHASSTDFSGGWQFSTTAYCNARVLFVGTGLDLISTTDQKGTTNLVWNLDEGNATGSVSQNASTTATQVSIPIVSSLANTMHVVELVNANGYIIDSLPFQDPNNYSHAAPNPRAYMDAFDVTDSGQRTRTDMAADVASMTFPAAWAFTEASYDADTLCMGGMYCYTQDMDTKPAMTFTFQGQAVGVYCVTREVDMALDWSIDGLYSGKIDLGGNQLFGWGIQNKVPYLIKNNLTAGEHTLGISASSSVQGIDLYLPIDCFDTMYVEPVNAVRDGYWAMY